jgi:hypothetical protein
VKYGGNHGIDLLFEGVGANEGRWAVAEAKAGKGLSSLEVDGKGLRQGSRQWAVDRLRLGGRGDLADLVPKGQVTSSSG